MNWLKTLLSCMVASLLLHGANAGAADAEWVLFKQRFLHPEGRIVDTGHRDRISHTEGQGMTMLLAVHHDDRAAFDAVWQWTRRNLQVRDDKLLAWRWSPEDCATGKSCVTDRNNASDGDLFVVWALLRAHRKWKNPDYLVAANGIIHAIRERLLLKTGHGTVLLPGAEGFVKTEGPVINLSYWLFPALQEIARADPSPVWRDVQQTGINLLLEGHFGRWGLPADWILMGGKLAPAPGFPSRFGYDSVRIPLYLLWAGKETDALLSPFKGYWGHFNGAGFMSAWTDLSDNSIDSYDASQGIRSIAQLTLAYPEWHTVQMPTLDDTQDYYSSVLLLLAKAMRAERATGNASRNSAQPHGKN